MRIALSGPSGCGKTTAMAFIARALNVQPIDYTLRHMAVEMNTTLDELRKKAIADPSIDIALDKKIFELAKKDNVIVGSRLAAWLDSPKLFKRLGFSKREAPKFDIKVWLTAPAKVRAQRISERDQKSFEEALKHIKDRDAQDTQRYKKLYKINLQKHEDQVDLLIDNARLTAEQTASLIVAAAQLLTKK